MLNFKYVGYMIIVRENHAPDKDQEVHLKTELIFRIKMHWSRRFCRDLDLKQWLVSHPLSDTDADCHYLHFTSGEMEGKEDSVSQRENITDEARQ